jgi:hypothetical protein
VSTLAPGQATEEISKPRSIGFLVYPDCEILDDVSAPVRREPTQLQSEISITGADVRP